jgi:methyltransferase-like protein/SAM-dependent methyltransferase
MFEPGDQPFSYDAVPYPTHPYAQTHPDRLATVSTLFGMCPRPIDDCSVLEIGCAQGGNIVPMAEQLPGSRFVGIDLSAVQIAEARSFADAVGLTNLEVHRMDIMDVGTDFGVFDYILCHGVYSWVADYVQDRLLELCANHLAPHGVAYISYNTYPGWHVRGMIRSMMRYHSGRFSETTERIEQARALLDFLAGAVSREDTLYGQLLTRELDLLRGQSNSYLYHDHLEDVNLPIYFYQFIDRAAAKGLQYLGEAQVASMYTGNLSPDIEKTLRSVATDLVQMEQYMDFVRNRGFRQTLLTHQDVRIDRRIRAEHLANLYVASPLQPAPPDGDVRGVDSLTLRHRRDDRSMTTRSPLVKAAMIHLASVWPASVPCSELVHHARSSLGLSPIAGADEILQGSQALAQSLLKCYVADLVEVHVRPADFTTLVGDHPVASATARRQVASSRVVTNRRHETVRLDDVSRRVLPYLDGTRGHEDLLDLLETFVEEGALSIHGDEGDAEDIRGALDIALRKSLANLAGCALLVR